MRCRERRGRRRRREGAAGDWGRRRGRLNRWLIFGDFLPLSLGFLLRKLSF